MVKNVDAAEVRVVVAAVLTAAADAVLVAHYLPKLYVHLVTARPVEEIAWRQEERGKKTSGGEAGQVKYTALCIHWQVNPRGEVPSASWNRWPYAAAPTQVSTIVTPPAPAAKKLGLGLQRLCSADV